jgi:regulator of sigma E protease
MAWLISILVLGLLVLVHELGHFLVARWAGVRVERFAIGFGRVLLRRRYGETEYCLCALPLGGYVKLAGEHRAGVAPAPGDFLSKSPGVRARIVVAGPLVNSLVSIVALWVVLVVGYPELLPTVGRLVEAMPAKAAGLHVGDRVVAVGGAPIRTWDELTRMIHGAPNQPLVFEVARGGTRLSLTVTPEAKTITDPFGRRKTVGLVGVTPSGEFDTYRLAPLPAMKKTLAKQLEWTQQIGLSLWSLLTGRVSPHESLTGPIGIIYMTSEAARMGFGPLLYLVSVFSLSLAIFNLFPIPILDGGALLFLALEKLRGTPVSLRVQEKAAQVSLAVLVAFVLFICVSDVNRFGLVGKFLEWWRSN